MIKNFTNILFMTLFLSISQNFFLIFAQSNQSIFPVFDLYGSVSYSSGVRLGGRMQISDHFSLETGFGRDLANFLGPSDKNYRYSVGINWHKSIESKLAINLTYVQPFYPPDFTADGYAISLNIGSLSLINRGFHLFYSGGIWLKRSRNIDFTYILPNLEFGIGWRVN